MHHRPKQGIDISMKTPCYRPVRPPPETNYLLISYFFVGFVPKANKIKGSGTRVLLVVFLKRDKFHNCMQTKSILITHKMADILIFGSETDQFRKMCNFKVSEGTITTTAGCLCVCLCICMEARGSDGTSDK